MYACSINFKLVLDHHVFYVFFTPRHREYIVHTEWSLKVPRHLIVHDNLRTITKYSARSVQNLRGLPQLNLLCVVGHCLQFDVNKYKS